MNESSRPSRTERYAFECTRCPRLAKALAEDREANPDHVARPISARGPASARLLILGLAPGHRGANRTGLVFAGDSSGRTLFRSLARAGLATNDDPYQARLTGVRLSNVVKCWPPANRPSSEERDRCTSYLEAELEALWRPTVRHPRAVLCLGRFAYEALLRLPSLPAAAKGAAFGHGVEAWLAPTLWLGCSFHPSRQNLNTGRLTQAQLDDVIEHAAAIVRGSSSRS